MEESGFEKDGDAVSVRSRRKGKGYLGMNLSYRLSLSYSSFSEKSF